MYVLTSLLLPFLRIYCSTCYRHEVAMDASKLLLTERWFDVVQKLLIKSTESLDCTGCCCCCCCCILRRERLDKTFFIVLEKVLWLSLRQWQWPV